MDSFEYTIIGAGIIGLAVARKLSENNKNVLVLEKEMSFGYENSSRNSGVVHAGIYYDYNSLKRKLCISGKKLLEEYTISRSVDFSKCGKLIISSNEAEDSALEKIKEKAKKNGVILKKLSKKDISVFEPNLICRSCLFSENTAVVDVNSLMLNFISDIELKKGTICYNHELTKLEIKNGNIFFSINNEDQIFKTKFLINCAGLGAFKVLELLKNYPLNTLPKIKYIKGNYMVYNGTKPFSRLVYPIPNKDGLGIHSNINFDGSTLFGPDSIDIDVIDFKITPGIKKKFINSIKKYWPGIDKDLLKEGFCGVRTKLDNDDFLIQDAKIHGINGLINVLGIDSPGVTSSLSLGNYIYSRVR